MSGAKRRILMVVSSSATSGAEKHAVDLAAGLSRRGHHVEMVCPPQKWFESALEATGVETTYKHMRRLAGLPVMAHVAKRLVSGQCDLVHTHLSRATYLSYLGAIAARKPLVVSVHVETNEPMYRWIGRGRNHIVAVSQFIKNVLMSRGVPGNTVSVVYNGIPIDPSPASDRSEVFAELGIPSEKRVIGLIGRVAEEKGHLVALAAFRQILMSVPDAHLLFVGRTEGEFAAEFMADVQSSDIADKVTFTGHREDVNRIIDVMDVSILPSVMEAFGLVVVECMARGKPVVATTTGALFELIDDGETGILVDQKPESFSAAVAKLLQDPSLAERIGAAARKVAHGAFSLDTMIEEMERLYEDVLVHTKPKK